MIQGIILVNDYENSPIRPNVIPAAYYEWKEIPEMSSEDILNHFAQKEAIITINCTRDVENEWTCSVDTVFDCDDYNRDIEPYFEELAPVFNGIEEEWNFRFRMTSKDLLGKTFEDILEYAKPLMKKIKPELFRES